MKLACWDYNGTVTGHRIGGQLYEQIRPNLKESLAEMVDDGFTHVITTTISQQGVDSSLPIMGIDGFISKVYGNVRDFHSGSKNYLPVLSDQGLSLDKASESAVVIGDSDTDNPGDIQDLVFIYNPDGSTTDARIIQKLLSNLYVNGDDNFFRGFSRFKTSNIDLVQESGFVYHGQLDLPLNFKGVFLSTSNKNFWLTPTVLVIPNDKARQFDKLEVIGK